MYIPGAFAISDPSVLAAFMKQHDFVLMVTPSADGLATTNLPILISEDEAGFTLRGHVARANPHWHLMDGRTESLVVFSGPHGYVSPTWYAKAPSVPTWNYATVHAHGRPVRVHDPDTVTAILNETTERYEAMRPSPWSTESLPQEFRASLQNAIVAFEMRVEKVEGKFKLSQNRSLEDRLGVVAGLEQEATTESASLAALMRRHSGV